MDAHLFWYRGQLGWALTCSGTEDSWDGRSPVLVQRAVGVVWDATMSHHVDLLPDMVSEHALVAGHVLIRLAPPETGTTGQVRSGQVRSGHEVGGRVMSPADTTDRR